MFVKGRRGAVPYGLGVVWFTKTVFACIVRFGRGDPSPTLKTDVRFVRVKNPVPFVRRVF